MCTSNRLLLIWIFCQGAQWHITANLFCLRSFLHHRLPIHPTPHKSCLPHKETQLHNTCVTKLQTVIGNNWNWRWLPKTKPSAFCSPGGPADLATRGALCPFCPLHGLTKTRVGNSKPSKLRPPARIARKAMWTAAQPTGGEISWSQKATNIWINYTRQNLKFK